MKLTNRFRVKPDAVAMLIPLPAIALSTGTVAAERMTTPEVIEEQIDGVADGIAEDVEKHHASEEEQSQQSYP